MPICTTARKAKTTSPTNPHLVTSRAKQTITMSKEKIGKVSRRMGKKQSIEEDRRSTRTIGRIAREKIVN